MDVQLSTGCAGAFALLEAERAVPPRYFPGCCKYIAACPCQVSPDVLHMLQASTSVLSSCHLIRCCSRRVFGGGRKQNVVDIVVSLAIRQLH